MKLTDLLAAINVSQTKGELPESINQISYHTAKVQPGDLFFCVPGYKVDGHQYLEQAREKGATVAVVQTFQPVDIPQILVEDSRLAMALMADCYYDHPSQKLHVVGVTATNGKTSTSFMIDQIFKARGLKTGIIGTVMTSYGDVMLPSVLTTPESADLHGYFADMGNQEVTHATMEVSSSGLELNRVGGVDFDVVTFNNISAEHIDQHGTFEAYVAHKSKLIISAKPSAWAILNLDDPYSKDLQTKTSAHVFTYGVKDGTGDLSVLEIDLSLGRARMTVQLNRTLDTKFGQVPPCIFEVTLSVAGYHSAINALAAIGVALVSGSTISEIQKGLKDYQGVERRFEILYEGDFMVIDDHFANGGNIDVTLETMSMMAYKNLTLVYAIRGSRGVTTNRENAQTIAKWAKILKLDTVIASKSQSHVIWKDEVTTEELAVFMDEMKRANISVKLYDELPDAISEGLNRVSSGDVLLLAGCQGMDFGGKIALEMIVERNPDLNPMDVVSVLKNRVCGV